MKLAESELRNIIREEIKNTISSLQEIHFTDLGQRAGMTGKSGGIPTYGNSSQKDSTATTKTYPRPTGPAPYSAAVEKLEAVRFLSNDLSKIDKDYVKSIIPASSIDTYASWVGPELKEKLDDLSLRYLKAGGQMTAQQAYDEFKALVEKYSPTRAKKGIVGTVTRGLSSFGLGTTTKE